MKVHKIEYKSVKIGILFLSLLFFLQLVTSVPTAPRNDCLITAEILETNYSPEQFIEADGSMCNQNGRLNPSTFLAKARIISSKDYSADDIKLSFYEPCVEHYPSDSIHLLKIFPSNEEEFIYLSKNLLEHQIISGKVHFGGDECTVVNHLTNYDFSQKDCPKFVPVLKRDGCNYTPIYNDIGCIIGYKEICNTSDCPTHIIPPPPAPKGCEYILSYNDIGCPGYVLVCEGNIKCQTNQDCDDEDACTSDICDIQSGKCTHSLISNGCNNIDSCIPIGVRVGNSYCDIDRNLKEQKIDGSLCNNMFECKNNVCIDGKCIQTNLIEKILRWFQRLFK